MRLEEQAPPPPAPEKERTSRHRSRDRIRRHEATVETIETRKEYVTKETSVEITVNANSEIRSTRIDDILKSVSGSASLHVTTSTSPPPEEEEEEAPPPPPPARTDTRDIKDILATHRSRPRRPFNDRSSENGVTSPTPKSPEPTPPSSKPASPPPTTSSKPAPSSKLPSDNKPSSSSKPTSDRPRSARSKSSSEVAPKETPSSASPDVPPEEAPATSSRSRTKSRTSQRRSEKKEEEDPKKDKKDDKRKKKDKKDENGLPTVNAGVAPTVQSEMPPAKETDRTDDDSVLDRLRKRKEKRAEPKPEDQEGASAPKTPATPFSPFGDDLEKQALDSLEGLTSDIIKERDEARLERNEARARCGDILNDYDGRRQAWQNQMNVVKIRLEHYSRRHDKLRNDIMKQQEQFDVERSRMKERHATQIEGLFGNLFDKIKDDNQYVGSSTGLDEVNYKLQAFMELWKGLAHDVDDLYDKEHYCLRLSETVKSLQDQIKHQNNIIAGLLKGRPTTDPKDMPNINVTIDTHHKWDKPPPPSSYHPYDKNSKLPDFDEFTALDNLLPVEDDMSSDDILAQFAPIEETFKTMNLSLGRPKKMDAPPPRKFEKLASPPPISKPAVSSSSPPRRKENRPRTPRRSEPRRSEPTTRSPSPPPKAATPPPPKAATPPPPRAATPPPPELEITVEVRDVPCRQAAPTLPKPSININRTIDDHNKQPELPIKVDPEDIRKRYNLPPKQPKVEVDTAPVVQSRAPFSGPSMFDDSPTTANRPVVEDPPVPLNLRSKPYEPETLPYNSYPPYDVSLPPRENGNAAPEIPTMPVELKETTIDDPKPKRKRKKKKPAKVDPVEVPVEPVITAEEVPMVDVEAVAPVRQVPLRTSSPSPTPSFRRRRASMESAKDFSVLGDPDVEDNPFSPPLHRHPPPLDHSSDSPAPESTLPKETTLDDPALQSPAPPPTEKKKKWKPSMPIFNKKLPKMNVAPPPIPQRNEPEEAPVEVEPTADQPGPSTSTSDSVADNKEDAPPAAEARPPKRAKSLPRFKDPSLPRNMASASMKRATSNPRLKKGPGSECDSEEDDSDSDIRSLIESVYMPLHLTPSRAGSKKNVNDDAKSTTSSFARRNKMPGSMGWLDSNNPPSDEDDSSDDYSSSEDDDDNDDSSSNASSEDEQSSESDDDYEIPPIADSSTQDLIPHSDDHDGGSKRNSMLDSIMRDFDDHSKNWMNNSHEAPSQNGEMLI